jgi:hypothetical protein
VGVKFGAEGKIFRPVEDSFILFFPDLGKRCIFLPERVNENRNTESE